VKKQFVFLLLFLCLQGYAQERLAKGFVLDLESHAALEGVEIWVEGEAEKAITNERGEFVIQVDKGYPFLLISKDTYKEFRYKLKAGFQHKPVRIYLESVNYTKNVEWDQQRKDSLFFLYRNAVSLSINEFLQIGLGLRYERFIVPNHSLGLHATYYFRGQSLSAYTAGLTYDIQVNYVGFKAAPFYRFYLARKHAKGLFIDAKIPFGCFSFKNLEYRYSYSHDSHRYKKIHHSFWTWGGGISFGFMSRLGKRKHGFINISVGYQYFPMAKLPEALYEETSSGHVIKYETDVDWWSVTGPGAKFECKFTIGGMF
jgi:hypothetical protein